MRSDSNTAKYLDRPYYMIAFETKIRVVSTNLYLPPIFIRDIFIIKFSMLLTSLVSNTTSYHSNIFKTAHYFSSIDKGFLSFSFTLTILFPSTSSVEKTRFCTEMLSFAPSSGICPSCSIK